MNLELDLGNTRCKWRLRKNTEIMANGALLISQPFTELESMLDVYRNQILHVWVASVVGKSVEQSLIAWSLKYLAITPRFARATEQYMGLVNGYDEPKKLGVDRWLGMVASYRQFKGAFLLASFGTAITIDIVKEDGKHVGGFIAPGLNLMLDSLQQRTHLVEPARNWESIVMLPGVSTTEAVHAALTSMVKGLIDNGLAQLVFFAPQAGLNIIFTGGDACRFLPFYPQAHYTSELVLDGLAYVLNNPKTLE